MSDNTSTKTCSKCKRTFPATLEYFQSQKRPNGKPGLHSWCKECKQADQRRHNKKWYAENREKALEYAKKQYWANPEKQHQRSKKFYLAHKELANERSKASGRKVRQEVLSHYGAKCECCGEERNEFLAIDHINGGGRKHRLSIPSQNVYRWLRNNGFPEGYRVLCHNCNMALGFYGYCPHQGEPTSGTSRL